MLEVIRMRIRSGSRTLILRFLHCAHPVRDLESRQQTCLPISSKLSQTSGGFSLRPLLILCYGQGKGRRDHLESQYVIVVLYILYQDSLRAKAYVMQQREADV